MTESGGPGRVLVVEDNPANQQLVAALLRRRGCEVVLADSAEGARIALASERPDAILMDLQLPDQDGLSLTRELLQKGQMRGIPIIALTAHAMHGDEETALAAGCSGYLTKPIDTRTFVDTVSDLIRRARERLQCAD